MDVFRGSVPDLSTAQMVEADRLMIDEYGIELIQMMENAGRSLACLARQRFLGGNPRGKAVVALAGIGGNGGGVMVCARHLSNWGADVRVAITRPDEEFDSVAAQQLLILRRMGLEVALPRGIAHIVDGVSVDLVIDGIIGYSLSGAPRGGAAELVRWANASGRPVLSLDVPSGVEATSGKVHDPAIRAAATLTLALPKQGLRMQRARANVGELYLADISVPPALYSELSTAVEVEHIFAEAEILRLA